jgi:hypothetical protein
LLAGIQLWMESVSQSSQVTNLILNAEVLEGNV